MSLNCLTCSQLLPRTDSYGELFIDKELREVCKDADRSWSRNVSPPPPFSPPHCELPKRGTVNKIKASHRRVQSTGNAPYPPGGAEPRLVRSSGMRRNWSFEDLTETQDQRVSCH